MIGKDGAWYDDINEMRKADAKWKQQQEIKEDLRKQNILAQKQLNNQHILAQEQLNNQKQLTIQQQMIQRAIEEERHENILREQCTMLGIDYDDLIYCSEKYFEDEIVDDGSSTYNNRKSFSEKFDEFRKYYYNKKVELLFKNFEFDFCEIEKQDIKSNGTAEDYQEFFENPDEFFKNLICKNNSIDYSYVRDFYELLKDVKSIAKEKYDEWHDVRMVNFVKEIEENRPLIEKNKSIQDCYDNGIRLLPDILTKYSVLSNVCDYDIDEYPEDLKEIIENRLNDFNKFRSTHYNNTFEEVLEELELPLIKAINKDNITSEGTIEDYKKYMQDFKNRREIK